MQFAAIGYAESAGLSDVLIVVAVIVQVPFTGYALILEPLQCGGYGRDNPFRRKKYLRTQLRNGQNQSP